MKQQTTQANNHRVSKSSALRTGSLSRLFRAGLVVAPNQYPSKGNEYRDDGDANEYRIDWHGWTPVIEQ
jgi:hypothetical protein